MADASLKRWYVVRSISGSENKIKDYIEKEIASQGLEEYVDDILVPTEKVVQVRNGKKSIKKKFSFLVILWFRLILKVKFLMLLKMLMV